MSTHPLVSVIIPTFNRRNDLLHCLRSLTESSYKNMEIIVVDNGSTDDTSEAVKDIILMLGSLI
ncbi:glycosyltransferase family 2 protein [Thermofilum sp.]|uniref:glycosyltransferase family 2 protein n=1 Tax=Thermofilum sp. TaxID=1961369 RepID=UPI003868A90F